jgi:hypothetical protein
MWPGYKAQGNLRLWAAHSSTTHRRSRPIMQLFKSTIVAILAFAAYATADGDSCQGVGDACHGNEHCCSGLKCNNDKQEVSTDLEL